MPTSASNIIVKNGTKNTVVSADDVNIDGTSVISALSSKQDILTPGTGIDITNNVISSTVNSAQWGNITGTISNQTDLQNTLNAKQDTLVSGTNIKTVNGTSLLGAGDVSIDITPDNLSITKDSNDHLQAVGTVNKNTVASSTNPVYDWVGTLQEYNDQNIETLHPDWICYITDDVQGGTSVYTKNEVNELLDVKANTDLDNLTSTGKNIANWSNNVTNCVTEIPQDIKIELNNGTLTLKAGSKVYVPNGVGVFDVVTVPSDAVFHTGTIGSSTLDLMFCCNLTGGFGARAELNYFESGSTEPSNTSHIWYDTTNNAIKAYENGSWVRKYSLPIGIYHRENGNAVSIKQVFNGFGYIGSTVFALPGVKGLIPNGRNADGTLKNTEFETQSVLTQTRGLSGENKPLVLKDNEFSNYITADYNEELNLNISSAGGNIRRAVVGTWSANSSGVITSFTPKTTFQALDRNDSSTISGWSMPSSRYIDLTLGASGSTYTAPANGWFFAGGISTGGWIKMLCNNMSTINYIPSNNGSYLIIPAKKGAVMTLQYAETNIVDFRFIYAEGEGESNV